MIRLLLTGQPGVGKTTVIRKVAAGLGDRRVSGFYTEEIRRGGTREGFRLVTFDDREAVIAHVNFRGGPRVSKYGIDVAAIERFVEAPLRPSRTVDLYIVDEIGKMECLSADFVRSIQRLLDSDRSLLATVAESGGGLIEEVKRRSDVELWRVTRENRDDLPERILARLQRADSATVE